MLKKLSIILLFLILSFQVIPSIQAQTYQSQQRGIFIYNVSLGFFTGGIGSLINKKKGDNAWKAFLKGSLQGGMGGLINYQAKNLTYQIVEKENYAYGWPARLTQSIGSSIIENSAAGRNFWEGYHFSYGPLRLSLNSQQGFKPSLRIAASALVGFVAMSTKGKLNLKYSLQSGAPFVVSDGPIYMFGNAFAGYVVGGTTAIDRNYLNDYELIAHEFIHIHQYEDFIGINTFFDKPFKRWEGNSNFFKNLRKIVYLDPGAPLQGLVYFSLTRDGNYYRNWFEFEAEHFGTKRLVFR